MKRGHRKASQHETPAGSISLQDLGDDELIASARAAQLLCQQPQTLAKWRHEKRGPAFYKVGRYAFYAGRDLRKFVQAQRHEPVAA
jgi:hypothetical protein